MSGGFDGLDLNSPWDDQPSSGITTTDDPSQPKFGDATGEPLNPTAAATSPSLPALTTSIPTRAVPSKTRGPPRRGGGTVAKLEAVDDAINPLGPLGGDDTSDEPITSPLGLSDELPPQPPTKEPATAAASASRGARSVSTASRPSTRDLMESVTLEDEDDEDGGAATGGRKPRQPPPVGAPPAAAREGRAIPPSVPVELAAKPTFDIQVGDPHKVGDLTSAHIVYQVSTKTSSKAYKVPEFTVSRRYRDFLWLYNSLIVSNPGVIVPPPPEKQQLGRFDQDFVESRRAALERMLNKIALHPILQQDGDLKIFLESESFNVDVKQKERQATTVESGGGGLFGSIGIGGAFSTAQKFVETDEWFLDRKAYLDALEGQLKNLMKSIDTVIKQRKELAESANDFGNSLHALSAVELSNTLSSPLASLADLQIRLRELYDRQAQQDVLTLGITVDEYIRLIGSVKLAFQQRQKAFHSWHAAESETQKKRATYEKLQRQGKTQGDRLNQMQADVADSEKKLHQARVLFDEMGRLMKNELERFEREKVEDFKSGVETFLESAVEAQKEVIELWETYLLQLDREIAEDETLAEVKNLRLEAQENLQTSSPTTPDTAAATAGEEH
ncbi:Vacuolar protein-sorting-associated protein [Drechslerella dactyloides]|uniref:Vacuolar protein-sorting-associated protein n=1 Tax=Drechslerella dactyloides TaxID=74499 RepID=A0AAD6J2K3_DREDA|nr:Vacuolar protein-sorting-associated protein [Drechslerella dactyloides]